MASGFSRLQLAAALLEYDNDPEDPEAPHRSAHESAIFAHIRRNGTRVPTASRNSEYLDVSLLSEGADAGQRGSIVNTMKSRTSRGSIDALRNPFGADDHMESEEEVEGEGLEVDLASWGLDAFMLKDKPPRHNKTKSKTIGLGHPHPMSSVPSHHPLTNNDAMRTFPRRTIGASRSMSVGGNLEYFGIEKAAMDKQFTLRADNRRRSIGSRLDLAGIEMPDVPVQRRRASSHTVFQTSTTQSIPFPTASGRSHSPKESGTESAVQTNTAPYLRERMLSNTSMYPKRSAKNESKITMDHARRTSTTTLTAKVLADDNPFSLRPPSRASRFDPKAAAHARTLSDASLGSRFLLDGDRMSVATGRVQTEQEHRRSTTLDLLRPKVLVMPSPLQPPAPPVSPPSENVRDGFHLSTDGPPLPPGARSTRRASGTLSIIQPSPPNPSNSFTPNPLIALSLSQLTFRNTLPIGGQRSSGYTDGDLPRAIEDGEQAQFETFEPEGSHSPVTRDPDDTQTGRPAGKLYGKSLIDDLENRKAQMRGKQRVFTGDQRPSMMARGSQQRASTLIDPATLQTRPVSQHMDSYNPQMPGRRNSVNAKPLLNFDQDDKHLQPQKSPIPNNRSVFGVDTLWEREMAKLKQIEIKERLEDEERRKREEENALKKDKRKKKRKGGSNNNSDEPHPTFLAGKTKPRVSAEPPTLPDIHQAPRRVPPQVGDDDSTESDGSQDAGPSSAQALHEDWYVGSSDEDKDDIMLRHITSTGPINSSQNIPIVIPDDNSDDDVPLAATISRAIHRNTHLRPQHGESDDEERPLSTLLPKKPTILSKSEFGRSFDLQRQENEDDDQPLGLRVSKLEPSRASDDDDRPLAYHPEQQRRTQYQMMAQQQQQQMMMQAQMQNSMFFSPPSMIGSPYFGPSMMPLMMQPPIQIPSPPPTHDEAKYGRVDRWRRDVAIEGDI
ncbi:hypothetical protein BDZ94DRAFT_1219541 [Collybia nuda]|uniref:Uncharacterized protein n=1 Tax=Collybia nuda TaxID=64659 RepID=A0A9P6CE65_9AGAR|nr:hypothetical protein BDZ94DRAFT_1219541 [Collybia nuda]